MTTIRVAVTARNEETSLPACLRSLLESVGAAEAMMPLHFDVVVVADDCTDATATIAKSFPRVSLLTSTGGKVEAQRCVANSTSFVIFSDADILFSKNTVSAVC